MRVFNSIAAGVIAAFCAIATNSQASAASIGVMAVPSVRDGYVLSVGYRYYGGYRNCYRPRYYSNYYRPYRSYDSYYRPYRSYDYERSYRSYSYSYASPSWRSRRYYYDDDY